MTERNQSTQNEPLALVGIGCRFPGGVRNADSLWELLVDGRSAITEVPDDRWNVDRYHHQDAESIGRMITRRGGFVNQLKSFDAAFWGISPREAMRMDPQQRWLLETAWEACEDAGCPPSELRGKSVGVFIGASSHDYGSLQLNDFSKLDVHTNTGGTLSIAANRISYQFDWKGPSIAVDTACSSALVAVSLACRSIWSGECEAALAGGVNALITPNTSVGFSKASMLSPEGECYAFDSRANGYVRGEGAGMIMLKPLRQAIKDHDRVYAVLRSAVVNQDGETSSMTVPSVEGQSEMLSAAYREAGVLPRDVAYIEAHGTGTPVGDPIEAEAIGGVLSEGRGADDVCWMGSIKTNVGHLESASGIAGLIKAALVLKYRQVPANRNFEQPNPSIPLDRYQLSVPKTLQSLPQKSSRPTIAAVNSFGFGGTNAHVVLESPPSPATATRESDRADRPFVLPLSARDDLALSEYAKQYRDRLMMIESESESSLADFCGAAGARKEKHDQRLFVVGHTAAELRQRLELWLSDSQNGSLNDALEFGDGIVSGQAVRRNDGNVFVFTGQGSQWIGMGRSLMKREPIVHETIREIDEQFHALSGWSLVDELARPEDASKIDETRVAQPAIFAVQVALVRLWASWGVHATAAVGHSVGEVAAAWCAGIYSLDDAISLIYHRSRLQNQTGGTGSMFAAGVSASQANDLIGEESGRVQVTAVNSPALVTMGGDRGPVESIAARLETSGLFVRRLGLDYAFHTHQMDPIRGELLESLAGLDPKPSKIPFVSTVTGQQQAGEDMDASYWWRNVREPVQFESAMATLVSQRHQRFLEIGPHPSLQSSIAACLTDPSNSTTIANSIRRNTDDAVELATNLAKLAITGSDIDWCSVNQSSGAWVPQPQYPWNYQEYWLDGGDTTDRVDSPLHPLLGRRMKVAKPTWQFLVDSHQFRFLNDHQIWNGIVFPASGYVEIGMAIAAELFPSDNCVVEDLECLSALFVSENDVPKIQVVFEPDGKTFQVFSAIDQETWEIHARGRLVAMPVTTKNEATDLESLRSRLANSITRDAMYGELHELGYGFGEDFSLIQEARSNRPESDSPSFQPESLARIQVTDAMAADASKYRIHPAVLDACFQSTHGTRDGITQAAGLEGLYLPESIGRVQMHTRSIPDQLWAHATRRKVEGTSIEYSIEVVDDAGSPVVSISRFRVAVVKPTPNDDDPAEHLYQFHWQPQRLPGTRIEGEIDFPATRDIRKSVTQTASALYRERELSQYYKSFMPRMQQIVLQIIENALIELGWTFPEGHRFDFDQLAGALGVDKKHHRLLRANLGWLTASGAIQKQALGWQVVRGFQRVEMKEPLTMLATEYPKFASEVALVQAVQPCLAEVLSGDLDSAEVLFPGGSSELLETFYTQAGEFPAINQLMQTAIQKSAENLPSRRVLRVLEVGAGTGSLTRSLLEVLPSNQLEYTFTDIGGVFLADAKRAFADHPSIRFQALDIERSPETQGFENHAYDLVVASNVLHVTSRLRSTLTNVQKLLAPSGLFAFLEVVRPRPIWDNVFGLLEGWWQFEDFEERDGSPLLSRSRWESLLSECDFQAVQSFSCSPESPQDAAVNPINNCGLQNEEVEQAGFLAVANSPLVDVTEVTTPKVTESSAKGSTVLVFSDESGVGDQIVEHLRGDARRVMKLRLGSSFERTSDSTFTLQHGAKSEIDRVWRETGLGLNDVDAVVHCWTLDRRFDGTEGSSEREQQAGVLSAMHLAQALEQLALTSNPRVYYVTRSAVSVQESDSMEGLFAAPVVGFCRVANSELGQFKWTLVDLDSRQSDEDAKDVFDELSRDSDEREIAFRDGHRHVHRLQKVAIETMPMRHQLVSPQDQDKVPFRLQMDKAGVLDHLTLNETDRRTPGPNEVEIRVMAGGINFRDVMKALGLYPGESEDLLWFGDDFSGVVVAIGNHVDYVQVGDRVAGIAPYAFRSHVTVDHRLTLKIPNQFAFEEAATLLTVFLTTQFAICHLARMKRGERILIHAAAGGVGQAAIQVAQNLGLEIFATAGTDEKRDMLKSMGVDHVMNSRSFEFADQIREHTGGEGVDAVLNSLAGEFVSKSLSILAPFGQFLEIGKVDIYGNSKIGLAALKNNISYHAIDLAQIIAQRPQRIASLLTELSANFESGVYRPLTHTVFPISEVVSAFRHMAQGHHVGKNVLSFSGDESQTSTITVGPNTQEGSLLRSDATYLISGGAGGFGLEIAKWMIDQGAGQIVLMSRSGPSETAHHQIDALRHDGANIMDVRGDVTIDQDVGRVVEAIGETDRPLKGIVHAAMVLDDAFLSDLSEERFQRVLNPKMLGAWNLHQATKRLPLDHFICFSSLSNVVGAPKQANYNAGNSFLDALAMYRRASGLPALTVNWGALLDAGFVARNQKTADYLDGIGLKAFRVQEALNLFGQMIQRDASVVAAGRVDWTQLGKLNSAVSTIPMYSAVSHEQQRSRSSRSLHADLRDASPSERLDLLSDLVAGQVAGVFGIQRSKVDRTTSLTQVGIDSLMAVELINRIESATGTSIPMNGVLRGPSVQELSQLVLDRMPGLDGTQDSEKPGLAETASIDFEREAELDLAIVPNASVAPKSVSPRVLLTGATGFLGAHILAELLRKTSSDVCCLVRADTPNSGKRRIVDSLSKYGFDLSQSLDRVRVVTGDFSRSQLGIAPQEYDQLAESVDVIYHNGANVNLVMPYHSLRPDNVDSTREMLRLACHRIQKPMHYVSTFTVNATEANRGRVIRETDPLPNCDELLYGYSQTKWVSERMIGHAQSRGVPVTIYRPGHVTGHSETGAANVDDLLHSIVRACLLVGAAPFRNLELDVTPVDFVSRAIVYLAQRSLSMGKVFHLTNSNPLNSGALSDWIREGGSNVELIAYESWRKRLIEFAEVSNTSIDEFQVLSEMLSSRLGSDDDRGIHGKFCNQQAIDALSESGIECPPADAQLLSTCHHYLLRSGKGHRIDNAIDTRSIDSHLDRVVQSTHEDSH